jgi:hypothetical protein
LTNPSLLPCNEDRGVVPAVVTTIDDDGDDDDDDTTASRNDVEPYIYSSSYAPMI